MTWPTVAVTTTNMDAGTDVPANARADIKDMADKVSQMVAHVSTFVATLLDDTTAAAFRATLAAAASGSNADITALTALTSPISMLALRSYLAGCGMSTAGSSATMSIAAGAAMDSTNAYLMQLTAIAKTTSAWAVGTAAGGLDTGSIANNTWYHFYVIRRPDTGVVDVLFSTNATTPTLPTNYTQFRRIGSGRTNASAQWTSFVQVGDFFHWLSPVLDVNTAALGTSTTLYTLSVPTGVQVQARVAATVTHSAVGGAVYINTPGANDETCGTGRFSMSSPVATQLVAGQFEILTNTSAQIQVAALSSSTSFTVGTQGWTDTRGRNA
jgi:hypothetical protein